MNMGGTTAPRSNVTEQSGNASSWPWRMGKRYSVAIAVWFVALLLFVLTCAIIHNHPRPYSLDLDSMEAIQAAHLWPLAHLLLIIPSVVDNPVPSYVALGLWLFGLLAIGLIRALRRLPALLWFQAAIFLAISDSASAGLNAWIDELVGRPRPDPHHYPIHVYTPLVPFPTYPSGHTEHDIVYYGFLLFLSFTRSVRTWRYRWLLLPFQIYAIYDILVIGLSRILEGDHWLTDVLGGYLEGLLYLSFFIFLYYGVTLLIVRLRAKKQTDSGLAPITAQM
jgi:membrane-associated phospholipid phosphatase